MCWMHRVVVAVTQGAYNLVTLLTPIAQFISSQTRPHEHLRWLKPMGACTTFFFVPMLQLYSTAKMLQQLHVYLTHHT